MKRVRGFSLIEVMIAVSIIATLAAIAVPAFEGHRVRANRAAAQAFLQEIYSRQEQFAIQRRAYASCATNPCAAAEIEAVLLSLGLELPAEVSVQYNLDLQPLVITGIDDVPGLAGLTGYEARATPKAGSRQQGAGEGALTVNQFGLRTERNTDNTVRSYW